jgi:hypothetical protein
MALRDLLVETKTKYGFISICKIRDLITQTTVEHHLELKNIEHSNSLKSTIIARSRKLIGILILLDLEIHIEDILGMGICDEIFPVKQGNIFFLENDDDKYRFYLEQWAVPLAFSPEHHMNLPREAILPFLSKTRVNHGTFGIVYKVRVADGHLVDHGVS